MSTLGVMILLVSVALSVAVAALSHGHVLFVGLPLLFGLPLAGLFGRRRR